MQPPDHNPKAPHKNIRVLFLTLSLYPAQSGGPSNTVYWLGKALTKRGVPVTTVTTSRDIGGRRPYDRYLDTDYGRVIYLDVPNYKYSPRLLWVTLRNLRRADILQPASLFYPIAFPSVAAAVLLRKKVVWSVRGELFGAALGFKSRQKRLLLWVIRTLLRRRVLFHATSAAEEAVIRQVMGKDVRILELPNLIELPEKAEEAPVANPPYLLYLGRINPIKAIDKLLRALHGSDAFRSSGYVLKIAGNEQNDYGEQLKELVSELNLDDKVQFLGLVTGPEKEALLAGAYFTVLPSHSENFGNVVLESLAAGTPVIASTGTPWESLVHEGAGYWADNTPHHLARTIDEALRLEEATYHAYRQNAARYVREHFEVDRNVGRWIAAYQALLKIKVN